MICLLKDMCIYVHLFMYMYVCVSVCVSETVCYLYYDNWCRN